MATIRNVISYVDAIKPNAFDEGVKVQWINEVEGYIQTEVMMLALADTVQYDPAVHMDTVLLVKPPHDKLYSLYLCALVDFANGEYDKYNNTMQMYNKFLGEYIKWYTRVFHPADGGCVREGYYLSAYLIATHHGFEGTEEEWIASLKGERGEPFEYEDFTPEQLEALTGPMGPAPQKGIDYWTDADKEELREETEEMISAQRSAALEAIADAESGSIGRLNAAADELTETAKQDIRQDIETVGNEKIAEIGSEGDKELSDIASAGSEQVQRIAAAGDENVKAVRDEGAAQVVAVRNAAENSMERAETAAGTAETARTDAQSAAQESVDASNIAQGAASDAGAAANTAVDAANTAKSEADRAGAASGNAAGSAQSAAESKESAAQSEVEAKKAMERAEAAVDLYPVIDLGLILPGGSGGRSGYSLRIINADGTEQKVELYDGIDGDTPTIGGDGNWIVGGVNTGVLARGVSPKFKVSRDDVNKSVTITASDADGATIAFVYDGKDCVLTDEDKREIADMVNAFANGLPENTAASVVNRTRAVQPMVTFVDDDGNADVWTKLKPLSEQYGIPYVSAMVTDRIGQDGSLTAEQLAALQDMGWEIASHTMGHVHLGNLTDAEQEAQMRGSKEALEAIGIKCDSICYPFSSTNDSTWKIARKYYRCGRQTNWKEWLNESPLETWDLRCTPIGSYYETQTESGLDTSTLEYYKWMVDRAVSGNAWLIFMTHCNETDETQMGYLAQVIEYVQSLGVPIVTLREGIDRRGNIIDNGRYDRRNLEDEHFVVGCDSTVEKSAPDKYAVNLPENFAVNGTPPSAFPWNTVSTCRVTGSTAGFPFQSVYGGGTLVTNTMGSAHMSDIGYKDYTDGRTWQEFYIPKSTGVFRRYALDADTWSEWSYGSDVVLAQDSRAIDDAVTKFPVGTKSKVWITLDGTTMKRPDGTNGWLLTDRTDVNSRLFWQTWIPMVKNDPKGNVYFRRWTGTAWDEWTCLGERTGSTNMLNWSITPKYVGASVFDTTRGKPVWWNGTAWVDATGAAV